VSSQGRVVAAAAAVSGSVADETGRPIAAASVRLSNGERTTTDARGAFAFGEVAPGTYVETISAARFEPYRVTIAVPGDRQKIVLRPSAPSLRTIGSVVAHPRTPFNTTPAAVKVFPREAYRDQGQPDLGSVLAQTPGALPAFARGENLAMRGVPAYGSVRASLPSETAVSFDGVPLTLPSTGAFDLSLIPSFVLSDTEIGKGPGDVSAIGPNAVAGALNLRSADPTVPRRALAEVSIDSRGGSFSDLAYGGTMPGGKMAIALMVAVDGSRGPLTGSSYPLAIDRGLAYVDGHPLAQNPDPYAATDLVACCVSVPSDDLRRAELLKLRYVPSDALTLTATYLGTQTTRALAGARGTVLPLAFGSGAVSAFASLAPSLDARENARLGLYDLDARVDRGRDGFDARLYALDVTRDDTYGTASGGAYTLAGTATYLDGTPPQFFAGTRATVSMPLSPHSAERGYDRVRGARAAWEHETGNGLLTVSAERRDDFVQDAYAPGTSATDTLANASLQLHPDARIEIDLGGGLDRHDVAGRGWTLGAFRAGASFQASKSLAFRASLGSSYAPPPLDALGSATVLIVAPRVGLPISTTARTQADLQPESAFGYDLGGEWRLHGNATTVSLDLYGTATHGAFARTYQAFPPSFALSGWANAPALHEDGIEASIVQFKRVGLGFIAQGALARVDRDLGPDAFFAPASGEVPLAGAPYAQGYGEISYKWPAGSRLSLGALYLGANNPYDRPAFATFNGNLELSLGGKSKLAISIENLFDANDAPLPHAFASTPLAPRTIRVMFRQTLGFGGVVER
jgi:hypothetical protein